jgi:error-prone DNA polymerase
VEALILCGALDSLSPRLERRRRLWRLHEVWPLLAPAGTAASGRRRRQPERHPERPQQLSLAWAVALATPEPDSVTPTRSAATLPALPTLGAAERAGIDYSLLGMSARAHPMRAERRNLRRRGVRAIAELAEVADRQVTRVAGWVISAQRPPTAHGMGFLVLEDETGRLPVALPPRLAAQMHALARGGCPLIITGRVERVRWYRSLLATSIEQVT